MPPDCYAYGRFASGVPIPIAARRLFRDDYPAWAGDPFQSFERWCHLPASQVVPGIGMAIPSLVMQWLHARSPAMAACSLSQAEGAAQTTRWWLEQEPGIRPAFQVDRRFLEPQALAAGRRAVPLAPSCPPPRPGRPDVTLVAAAGPAQQVMQAVANGLRLAVPSTEQCDHPDAAANGRWVGFCLPLEQLAAVAGRAPPAGDGYRVFIPSGERAALSPAIRAALARVDEIWAPTRFIQAALVGETDRPVLHMPVAWPVAGTAGAGDAGGTRGAIIQAVADGLPGCGEIRAALRAYQLAFARWPAAPRLVIQAKRPDDGWDDELASMVAAMEGVSLAVPSPSAPDPLLGAACVLSLHRGEALGLPVLRAMARGVPVVATDYGGCTDLLTPQTGFPVEYRLDGGSAEVDPRHAAWWLQRVFDRPDEARRRARQRAPGLGRRLRPGARGRSASPALAGARFVAASSPQPRAGLTMPSNTGPHQTAPALQDETELDRVRRTLADARADLQRHDAALSRLQADLLASRLEVASARTETVNYQTYLRASQAAVEAAHAHLAELRAAAVEREAEIARLHAARAPIPAARVAAVLRSAAARLPRRPWARSVVTAQAKAAPAPASVPAPAPGDPNDSYTFKPAQPSGEVQGAVSLDELYHLSRPS